MAETGVENRIMGNLNAYSPEVSGRFPASPFSPSSVDITRVWTKLLWVSCSLWSHPQHHSNPKPGQTQPDLTNPSPAQPDPSMAQPDPTVDGCRQWQ